MRRRTSPAVLIVSLVVGGAVSVGGLALMTKSTSEKGQGDKDKAAPPPSGVFATGGKTMPGSEELRRLFREKIPELVIELDAERRGKGSGKITKLRTAIDAILASEKVDKRVVDAMQTALDWIQTASTAGESDADENADQLAVAVVALDEALAAAALPYYVDSEVLSGDGRHLVLLFTFEVLRAKVYRVGDQTFRVLHVERLDSLNWTYRLLGFTGAQRRDAVILLHKLEERLVSDLLPAIAPNSKAMPFGDHEQLAVEEAQALGETAREALRSELGVAYVEELARLIHRRAMLVASWKEALDARGLALEIPITLSLQWEPSKQLGSVISETQIAELVEIQKKLAVKGMQMAFADLSELLVASVEQHELQHRIDFATENQMVFPSALESYVGPLRSTNGEQRPLAFHSRAELSAYLAEIGRGPTPKIVLTQLANFLLDKSHWGSAESYAAVVAFEFLAGALDIPIPAPLIHKRSIQGKVVATLYRSIASASSARLRAAAADSWSRLFKGELASPRLLEDE